MTGSVLSTGDGHQGWQDKLSIMMVLELSICLKTGAMTLKTVLDKGYGSQAAGRRSRVAAGGWLLTAIRCFHLLRLFPDFFRQLPDIFHWYFGSGSHLFH